MQYSAGIVSKSFWYLESRKTVGYILEGLSRDEVVGLSLTENVFQTRSSRRAQRMASALYKRFDKFSEEILKSFMNVDTKSAKIFILISILKLDKLFFEFMYEVFREHILLGNLKIERRDLNIFFDDKRMQSEKVASWKEETITKLKSTYLTILRDADLLDKENNIIIPLIDLRFEELLVEEGYEPFLSAVKGV